MNTQELIAYVEGYTLDQEESKLRGETMREMIRPIIEHVEDLISQQDWRAINDLFDLVMPEKIQPIFSMAFLRTPFRVKEMAPNWYGLRDRVVVDYKRRKLDIKRRLVGLTYQRYDPEYLVAELLRTIQFGHERIFLDQVMERVETHFYYMDLDGLDAFLRAFTPHADKFQQSWVTSVLRASSRAKTKLKEWAPLRDKLVVRCEREGMAYKTMLRGLLDK